ncbi:MAG: dienelactone hydrolase family protein [Alphaproteobacteria bacterium]
MGETITLSASDGHSFAAYRAPAEGARKGGLVLIQEIFGVTPHIRELCDHFAAHGYETLAPAIFDRIARDAAFGYDQKDIDAAVECAGQSGVEIPMLDIQACVDRLGKTGPVAITGFCYGGSLTWMAASRVNGLACAVGFYGRLIPDHLDEHPKCPTMLHFGSRDKTIPLDAVRRTAEAHPDVKVHIYRADHGFWSDRPANHDEPSIEKSGARTLAFFEQHMGG